MPSAESVKEQRDFFMWRLRATGVAPEVAEAIAKRCTYELARLAATPMYKQERRHLDILRELEAEIQRLRKAPRPLVEIPPVQVQPPGATPEPEQRLRDKNDDGG